MPAVHVVSVLVCQVSNRKIAGPVLALSLLHFLPMEIPYSHFDHPTLVAACAEIPGGHKSSGPKSQ
eukprot:1006448-Pelagomonas_calceolata.AAC.5